MCECVCVCLRGGDVFSGPLRVTSSSTSSISDALGCFLFRPLLSACFNQQHLPIPATRSLHFCLLVSLCPTPGHDPTLRTARFGHVRGLAAQ